MKKFKKLIVMFLILSMFTSIIPSISVHADVEDQNGSIGGGNPYDGMSPAEIAWAEQQKAKEKEEQEKNKSNGEYDRNDDEGKASEGTVDMTGKDGALASKTGYLIYATEGTSIINNAVAFVTSHGQPPYSTSGAPVNYYLKTRIGSQGTTIGISEPVVWGFEPFDGSSGNGVSVADWLVSDYIDGETGATWVMGRYLGFSRELIEKLSTKDNTYLHVEAVMWAGVYSKSTHTGQVGVGTALNWTGLTDHSNYLSRYTHANLPNSLVYDKDWLGIIHPKDISNKHDNGTIQAYGYGIVSVKLIPSDRQIVKVYRTSGVVDRTTYSSCGDTVTFQNEGSYIVKDWTASKKKTTAKDPKADYSVVVGGGEVGGCQSGVGARTGLKLKDYERAIFILLERDKDIPVPNNSHNDDYVHAYELNYAYPMGGADTNFERLIRLKYTPRNFSWTKPTARVSSGNTEIRDWHIESYRCNRDDSYYVDETRTGTANGNSELYHRYHNPYKDSSGRFNPFNPTAPDSNKIFPFSGTILETRYSYTIPRSLWESGLVACNYVGSGGCHSTDNAELAVESNSPYISSILGIEYGSVGSVTGVDHPDGIEKEFSGTQNTSHTFYAKAIEHWEERTKSTANRKDANGNDVVGADGNVETVDVWSDWSEQTYSRSQFILSYNITHHADKYRANMIGCVSNPNRNHTSNDDIGNGGTDISFGSITTEQYVVSQRSKAIKVYPEVQMMAWVETVGGKVWAEPKKRTVYMMGEYKREASPAALHFYFTGYTNGSASGLDIHNHPEGTTILESAATGTIAQRAYSDKGSEYNGSTAMGTTFNTSVKNRPGITMVSAVLGLDDCDHTKSRDWYGGETKEDAEASHKSYVSNFSNIQTDLYMRIKDYEDKCLMSYSQAKADTTEVSEVVALEFYEGAIQKGREEAIRVLDDYALGSEYSGEKLWEEWGVEEQIKEMFESCNDDFNHSGSYCQAQEDGEGRFGDGTRWYDEETYHLTLRFFKTTKIFGQIYADDKLDYNMLPQDARSRYLDRGKTLEAQFYVRFWLGASKSTSKNINADTDIFKHSGELRCEEVRNTRFIIDNLTTAEMKK